MSRPRLIAFDDEPDICELVSESAEQVGFEAVSASDFATFTAHLSGGPADVVVLDLQIPGVDGIEVMRHLGSKECKASIIILSGVDERTLAAAERVGRTYGLRIHGRFRKPFLVREFQAELRSLRQKIP